MFLDLKKAFDTVSTKILVDRLEKGGITGVPLVFLKDYLSDRTQCTKIAQYTSEEISINYGVPQGGVLGPTLFLLYVNILCDMKGLEGQIFSYAGDTAVVFAGDTWANVKQSTERWLSRIASWLSNNLLKNILKTNYITFTKYITSQSDKDFQIKFILVTKIAMGVCKTITRV